MVGLTDWNNYWGKNRNAESSEIPSNFRHGGELYHDIRSGLFTVIHRTWDMSLKSWLTSSKPPSKSLIASASASIVSISRWLVGSSRNSMWGVFQANHAKMTRQRWPSDRLRIGQVWGWRWQWKQVNVWWERYSCDFLPAFHCYWESPSTNYTVTSTCCWPVRP